MKSPLSKPVNFSLHGFFKVIRFPNLLIIAFTQYMTAAFLVGDTHEGISRLIDINLLLLVLSTLFIAAAGYIINDYYDVKIDYINKPKRVVVGRILKRRGVMVAHTILNFMGILIGFYLSIWVGIISVGSAFMLWWYSNQLKRLPFIGNFFIAVLTGASIFLVGIYYQQHIFLVNTYAFFAFSITLIREIVKDMEDLKGDADFGCRTLPILLGIRKTKIVLYFFIGAFIFIMFYLADRLGNQTLVMYFLILSIPILHFLYVLIKADTVRHFRMLSNYCKVIMLSGILSMAFF